MRLFELFDNPLEYRLMNTTTNTNEGSKQFEYGFRVGDFWYKVWIEVYPTSSFEDDDVEMPWDFYLVRSHGHYIMSIDFGQFEYGEKKPQYPGIGGTSRSNIPIGVGDAKSGREGTGNELQVFGTVAAIAKDVFTNTGAKISVIEYGAKVTDPNRKRLYASMLRKFGITGKVVEMPDETDDGVGQDRVYIVLNSDK